MKGDAMTERSGDEFQRRTKYYRGKPFRAGSDSDKKPTPYKRYPDAPKVPLDPPMVEGGMPLWEALQRRRSLRRFRDEPLAKAELSQLLWAGQGINTKRRITKFRTAPSAGGLHPVETYLVVYSVEGIEPGVYHYVAQAHELEQLRVGDFRASITQAALDQRFVGKANAVFVWTAVFERCKWRYGQRGYRYIYLDAGHIGQNVALVAVALGLGSCQVGALYDDEVNDVLGVDGTDESVVYMTAVGRKP
jgi:SagB-type dehydrogenase family enzyme